MCNILYILFVLTIVIILSLVPFHHNVVEFLCHQVYTSVFDRAKGDLNFNDRKAKPEMKDAATETEIHWEHKPLQKVKPSVSSYSEEKVRDYKIPISNLGSLVLPTDKIRKTFLTSWSRLAKERTSNDNWRQPSSGSETTIIQSRHVYPHYNPVSYRKKTSPSAFINSSWDYDKSSVREIQENQCLQVKNTGQYMQMKDVRSPLVIVVDARPKFISGYCINLDKLVCKYYTYSSEHLPWKLEECNTPTGNPAEFEMKNMMFALMLWEEEIKKYKKYIIYTDNSAINAPDCPYGSAVGRLLEHFGGCESIVRVNNNAHINRRWDLQNFARFIQPADELTHWNLILFKEFLIDNYGIKIFCGSHQLQAEKRCDNLEYYPKSKIHPLMLAKVTLAANKWTQPCLSCGFCFPIVKKGLKSLEQNQNTNCMYAEAVKKFITN